MAIKTIFVVTHPQSVHHVEGRVGGWYDTPLTALGRRHAQDIAERLATLTADHTVEIFTSDLLRTGETAAVIGQRLRQPVEAMQDLREISYGVAGGRPQSWLDANRVAPGGNRLDDDRGIEGAESRRAFATRIYRAVEVIIERPAPVQIVVTHGFALTFVIAAFIGMPIEAVGKVHFACASGSITHLAEDAHRRNRSVVQLADISHLTAVL